MTILLITIYCIGGMLTWDYLFLVMMVTGQDPFQHYKAKYVMMAVATLSIFWPIFFAVIMINKFFKKLK